MKIGAVIAFVVIICVLFNKCGGSSSNDSPDEEPLDSLAYEDVDTVAVAWDDSTASYEDIYTDDTDNDVSYVTPKQQSSDEITKGSENYEGGSKFVGTFKNGVRLKGTYTWANGNRFEGDFKDGKLSQGTLYFADGERFSGNFNSNEERTYGVYYYTNGDRYEGNFNSNGLKHGSGTYYWKDGDRYEGNWENDKQNGYGVHYNADGSVWFKGQWNNGDPVR